MPLYVLTYKSSDDVVAKARRHFAAHKERIDRFHARGDLLMVGTFADPQTDGSMGIFASRDAAEEFVAGDPFVLEGVVRSSRIREWNEMLRSA